MSKPLAAIILAAGKGTRMKSDLPKVAHEVAGAPMVRWVVAACRQAGCERISLVVGHRQEVVREIFAEDAADIVFVEQTEQLGTGHAVMCAKSALADFDGDVLVLCGDGPLIRGATLANLVERHQRSKAICTMATATVEDSTGYGRVVRDEAGAFVGIVEEKNATLEQREIREINPSYYCFDREALFGALERVGKDAISGEYYVTEAPSILLRDGVHVDVVDIVPADEVHSINTLEQLEHVAQILRARANQHEVGA